ncbi:hypothetical protein JHK82_028737 [Glycine max]|nr:hypothetical protein JHK87_028652 [Glycine soja]KAG4997962.1 hypothetical protein JHK85_029401 [Glycine max]KAG5004721.1 hypothetical protein JHK86_028860 [Glycine max]KAG5127902.1 hypothetical protein JHK82_028737 [Glycine max]KAG5152516.1 hypothetical protein JHK84_028988 [Glycine max]
MNQRKKKKRIKQRENNQILFHSHGNQAGILVMPAEEHDHTPSNYVKPCPSLPKGSSKPSA